ncbi:MAG: exo-alpha-sialidase [Euzebyales bacterium]|jgi:hypothetical protein|nr:exo-alpha-sialidase [Euzebyales bacterium]
MRMPASPRRPPIVAALAVALAACGGVGDAAPTVSAAELVHVHGLAENPDAEGIYVATHTGLFEVRGDTITRVTERYHDLMGFTVVGPGDYLASGHPELQAEHLQAPGKPPLLGLVESSDGVEWEPVSLLGETDFHNLEAKHDRVYGYDATNGAFLISEDRTNWDTMSDVALIDFSVSPDDPDLIVGTGQAGVTRSDAAGATWSPLDAPPYVFLDWSADGLFGVTVDGRVGVSTDAGDTWDEVGAVDGQPEAILASPDRLLVAVADRGVFESTDGGETFDIVVATDG